MSESAELWVKIVLPGMDAIRSSLQGRVTEESFDLNSLVFDRPLTLEEALNKTVAVGLPFKLFDPIQLLPHVMNGQIGTVTLPLIQALEPAVSTNYIWVSGAQIQWWAPLENDSKWQAVVSQTIHGIAIAGSEDMPPEVEERGGRIITPDFRR